MFFVTTGELTMSLTFSEQSWQTWCQKISNAYNVRHN